jgi:histidine ammonia-lyase
MDLRERLKPTPGERLKPAPGTAAARACVRSSVRGPGPDRWLSPELAAAEQLVVAGVVLDAVEAQIGALK